MDNLRGDVMSTQEQKYGRYWEVKEKNEEQIRRENDKIAKKNNSDHIEIMRKISDFKLSRKLGCTRSELQ